MPVVSVVSEPVLPEEEPEESLFFEAVDQTLQVRVVHGQILHIVQHTVIPQVTGNVVQDQAVDLTGLIEG